MIDYTLGVTSPMAHGQRVLHAQKVLNGGNVFGRDFHQGAVDGVFGEETGRSCLRAKKELGYPTRDITPTYGPYLDAFLTGEKKLTPAMLVRQKLRARAKPYGVPALVAAHSQIGVKESPAGSNRQKYGAWYGMNGVPWCAIFASWCYHQAGSSLHYAYVPYVVADARAGRNGLRVVEVPQPGDLVCYDWDGGLADHMGLFEARIGPSTFTAVEGNTSVSNDSNGGQVMRRSRTGSMVQAYVRVGR